MDLGLTDEQEQLADSFRSLFAKGSTPEAVREAEPLGFDPKLWETIGETGAVAMAVPEGRDGWGATLVDLALVAEQAGRAAAPVPLVDAQVAARLLAAVATPPALDELRSALGDRLVTVAVRPARQCVAELVPAGAVCASSVVLDGRRLVLVGVTDAGRRPVTNLASSPLADLDVGDHAVELADGDAAVAAFETAVDEWLVLTAAAVVGSASTALDLGSAYAAERVAFGRRIGAFQAIAHPFADSASDLDGARLLVHKAAWALDTGDARARELAAMAFAFTCEAAQRATYHALHAHGGYGFMLEYDVQLHYRRVRGWPRVWGDADAAYRRAADARYPGEEQS